MIDYSKLENSDKQNLRHLWKRTNGESWEPGNPRLPMFDRMIAAGFLKRADGRFLYEAMRDAFLVWTQEAKEEMPTLMLSFDEDEVKKINFWNIVKD